MGTLGRGRKEEILLDVGQLHMAAAYIIPFLLNNFDVNATGGSSARA